MSRDPLEGKVVKVRGVPICAHAFDSMLCVARPGHPGPHVTSNNQFPQGVPKQAIYADLASLPEDERIRIIGEHAAAGEKVAFIVDDSAKADRYIRKLLLDFPSIRVIERGPGPVGKTVYVKVGLA